MIRLVLFSQDPKLQHLIPPALGSGFEVVVEDDSERLQSLLQSEQFDVAIADLDTECAGAEMRVKLPEMMGDSGPPVIILADDSGRAAALDLVRRGAYDYLRKPPSLRELKDVAHKAYEHVGLSRQREEANSVTPFRQCVEPVGSCDGLIGKSRQMLSVYELIRRVTNLNASVLIAGESGTGKELIARAIHNLGSRRNQPFLAVSCGAIPETLIESELFGHEKGAFTGSVGMRSGFFEQVGSGTLFLDEIGELSPQTQVKLLRVLQQREFSRLGSNRMIPFKARVVFATHRDLPRMISDGKFRLDLYYRINVMTITAPALADRSDDIPLLATHFLKQYAELFEKPVTSFHPRVLALLEHYDWPGNVRELENAIQSAIIRCDGDTVQLQDLPALVQAHELPVPKSQVAPGSFEQLVQDFKTRLAFKAVEACNGNKSLAADRLHISRAYLHRLIRPVEAEMPREAA